MRKAIRWIGGFGLALMVTGMAQQAQAVPTGTLNTAFIKNVNSVSNFHLTGSGPSATSKLRHDFVHSSGTNEGFIEFSSRGTTLKASGYSAVGPSGQQIGEGHASFHTTDLRFVDRNNVSCGLNCNHFFVIFRMNLTGSITHGTTPGRARGFAAISVSGPELLDLNGNPVGGTAALTSRFDFDPVYDDASYSQHLNLGFYAKPGALYTLYGYLELLVSSATWFSSKGSVTADFGSTFDVADPYNVFQLPAGYTAESSSLGLVDNQIPDLFEQSVPVPASGVSMAAALGLAGFCAWRRRERR